jgi:putative nucleotidyltransferase with HDIG domain
VPAYTTTVAICGLILLIVAVISLPADWLGLVVFSLMVFISELGNVELFRSSRGSSVSVSMAISVAAIIALGPLAGVLIQVASGLAATISKFRRGEIKQNNASWIRVSTFNIGMFVLSTAAAGQVYLLSGGRTSGPDYLNEFIPLVLTVIVDTVVNISLLIGVIWLQTGRSPWLLWKQDFQWSMPITILGGVLGGGALGIAYQNFGMIGTAVFFVPLISIGYSFRIYANNMRGVVNKLELVNEQLQTTNTRLGEANAELQKNNIELLQMMAAVIDAYDDYTHRHSTRVAEYAGAFAQKMNLPAAEQEQIVRASLVHDIGKIGVSLDRIIHKQDRLCPEEYDLVKKHPVLGADILGRMKCFEDLLPLVRHHHEKYDGSGYPDHLIGESIPLGARILTLADSLEAMLSDRPYRKGLEFSDAVAEVLRCSGSHFDPQVVKAFLKVLAEKGTPFFLDTFQSTFTQSSLASTRQFLMQEVEKARK